MRCQSDDDGQAGRYLNLELELGVDFTKPFFGKKLSG
jgi:hypothetical protein